MLIKCGNLSNWGYFNCKQHLKLRYAESFFSNWAPFCSSLEWVLVSLRDRSVLLAFTVPVLCYLPPGSFSISHPLTVEFWGLYAYFLKPNIFLITEQGKLIHWMSLPCSFCFCYLIGKTHCLCFFLTGLSASWKQEFVS